MSVNVHAIAFLVLCGAVSVAGSSVADSSGPRMSATVDYRLPVKAQVVSEVPGYNSWPMIQALGDTLVCSYSRDSARPADGHSIGPGSRDSYLRLSRDGGRTWSAETVLAADPNVGEVNEGSGLDSTGAALLWVRCWGKNRRHELYRTVDGVKVEKIATVIPDPFPMQVTDPVPVAGMGLVSPWFAGDYQHGGFNSWGLLVSQDDGRTWTQRVIEERLSVKDWVTEPSLVDLGGGRVIVIGRCERNLGNLFQVTSSDGGKTWFKRRTNISDVRASTPSLVYDRKTDILSLYYYHRGARHLKRRVVRAAAVFDRPEAWPHPEVLDNGFETRPWDAGNVNVTRHAGTDYCAWYTGTPSNSTVVVTAVDAASTAEDNLSFFISNHDQSPTHRVIHPIVGKTNFVYDAHGALEKVHGEAIAFLVKDSENVTIRNLRLDWERPCLTEAKVVSFGEGVTRVTIDRKRYPYVIENGKLLMVGPGWTNGVSQAKLFDARTREQIADASDVGYDGAARQLDDGTVEFAKDFSRYGVGLREGDVIALRPRLRDFPAIVVYNSKNTVLEDVVVHDSKGMALIAQRSDGIVWRGTKTAADKTSGVFPRPGSYASAHADASHFSNVRGEVKVENCWFEGMMDDAINVHSTCLAVTNVIGSRTLCCRYMHEQAIGFELFLPGERLRFIRGATLENGPELTVSAVRMHSSRDVEITLAADIPSGWGIGDAVENADYQCAATFRGNVVCNNRARGTLFTTPLPVVVESNLFNRVTGSPLLFAGDNYYWYESGACRDVTIRGNIFSNCCTAASRHGYSKGVISFYPIVRDFDRQKARYHGNVLVEDNEFAGFDVPLLFAISTENIVWRNNRVDYNTRYGGWEEPPFVFKHCRNIQIDGREVSGDTVIHTAPRSESTLTDGWEFRKEPDTAWRKVRVPHDWAIESPFDPNGEPGAGRLPYAGTGWYRRRFTLPPESAGQVVLLDIGGAMTESDVFLNGIHVGGRAYGFESYRVNLTSAIRAPGEENLLEIRCLVPPKSARFYFGAGLYRPVKLVCAPPVHVGAAGVFVTTEIAADGSAKVKAEVDVKGPLAFVNAGARNTFAWGDVRILNRVLGEDGMVIRKPRMWSPEEPNLYTLETTLTYAGKPVDTVRTRFGVRTLRFDPKKGFFLNGKYRQMKGVCLHHDLGSLGAAFDRGAFERQVRIMKEMGADAIRTSHNPPAREALDVCDEIGMMVMDEAFDVWNRHKFPADYATHFDDWSTRDMIDFVLRDRNHPCVVMWSIGNEIPGALDLPRADRCAAIGRHLTRLCHRYDPTRLTTMGHCRQWAMTNGMETASDVFGANYLPWHYEWYLKNGTGRCGLIATETCSTVAPRGGEEYQFRKHNYLPELEFKYQQANPACYGEFVWTGFDYLGEPDPWAKDSRSSYYGIVDLCGFPKDRYWTYRRHWRPDAPEHRPEAKGAVPSRLELSCERYGDLAFVNVKIVDAEGRIVPAAKCRVKFALSGDLSLEGVGNGNPRDYDSLKGDSIRVFEGLAQAIVRMSGSGSIKVTPEDSSLTPVELPLPMNP